MDGGLTTGMTGCVMGPPGTSVRKPPILASDRHLTLLADVTNLRYEINTDP